MTVIANAMREDQDDRDVAMKECSTLPFRLESEATVARRQVVSPHLHRSTEHFVELLVGKPDHLSLRMP